MATWNIVSANWREGYSHEDHLAYESLFDALVADAPTFSGPTKALRWAKEYLEKHGEGDIKHAAGLEIVVHDDWARDHMHRYILNTRGSHSREYRVQREGGEYEWTSCGVPGALYK